jgi:hypothetical protein
LFSDIVKVSQEKLQLEHDANKYFKIFGSRISENGQNAQIRTVFFY